MRKSNSKLSPILRAMDAYERRTTPAEPTCAIAGCDAWPVTRCVCCKGS